MLDSQKKQALKAKAHKLNPVVMIGDKGLTENVLKEVDAALEAHELIKVKIASNDREARKSATNEICLKVTCELVQIIGNISILYRQKTKKKG
ncbi:ribosome assembly RNA-binding protein YhbY [Fangia hongkongensis]|uniref:ribosome assembly RNA-binding protein YhbY n=1 Tax=Fangia hongkongensis TaxID=270495 RepID=UPI000376EFF7|nr:ribosome assembly RNA-binding protein YhbY [Fangia hongkongensis]MBK2123832.1 ribosome assembly RNA-binding protein YhbY [Fangia hongkongensis]